MQNNTREKKHIFISYSRADADFLRRLSDSLRSLEIPIWIDVNNLQPGTPNWQKAIRTAVKSAYAMILLSSPNCATSEFIQAEIELAKAYDVPIIPIWMHGELWVECVPLQLVSHQNIDCRAEKYRSGIEVLAQQLSSVIPKSITRLRSLSANHATIFLPDKSTVLVLPNSIGTIREFLNFLYLEHLQEYYRTFSYGADWILISQGAYIQRVFAPWNWS